VVDVQFSAERRLEITAGAERVRTGAGEDTDKRVVVAGEPAPRIDELGCVCGPIAFMRSGRLIVMTVTGPRCS
jgi:hypothetical protein